MKKQKLLFSAAFIALTLNCSLAAAMQAGDVIVRARALTVKPQEDATISGAVTGSSIDIDTSVVPELDVSYFFSPHIAMELIAAITPHDVRANNTSGGNLDLGSVWLLPPTLTVQYHFDERNSFKPYIGAGVNYTKFFNENAGPSITSIDSDSSFGPALQLGVDYMLNENWMLNADVKKMWINSDVKINGGAVNADVDINPWVFGVGVGYKF
jgi:outer membrane protein